MKRENLYQPFEISFSELDESLLKEHKHSFFELVYILSGTGIQWINNNMFPYHDGHLFMITPGDTHSFEIHTTTKFVDIKFNDTKHYFSDNSPFSSVSLQENTVCNSARQL